MRVVPNVAGIDKAFDYTVPETMSARVRTGSRVRVVLNGRRVDGWVVEDGVVPPPTVTLRPIAGVKPGGPTAEVVDLARWAAWRWAGRLSSFLATASGTRGPSAASREEQTSPNPPVRSRSRSEAPEASRRVLQDVARDALSLERSVARLAPATDPFFLMEAACRRMRDRDVLVLLPSRSEAARASERLSRLGLPVELHPRVRTEAAGGARVVVGTRSAAWAPLSGVDAVVVVDAHDEAYQEERAPTWNAWVVAAERARRAGAPCVLTSPCPTLEMLAWGTCVKPSREVERQGWAVVDVIDRRGEDPRSGLYSSRLVPVLRRATPDRRVVCVLNRKGRARLLACTACSELARCEQCQGPVAQKESDDVLRCRRCGLERPWLCAACGSQRLRVLRQGVSRARQELEALAGGPVAEVTSASGPVADDRPVVVGTEAALHRVTGMSTVVFMDFDAELLSPWYQASELAMALLCRAARAVGGRAVGGRPAGAVPDGRRAGPPSGPRRPGRVVVQTRLPTHPVIAAAVHADPGRLCEIEAGVRETLQLPPSTAIARVSGESATDFVSTLREQVIARGPGPEVAVTGPSRGTWLLRAPSHAELSDVLAATPRPTGRLRVEVDPRRA